MIEGFGTVRLRCRPLVSADWELFRSLYGDAELLRHVSPPLAEDVIARRFRYVCAMNHALLPTMRHWVLHEQVARADIGLLGLIDSAGGQAEIGALLTERWQARGYAQEAIRALVAHAFLRLGHVRLCTHHLTANALADGLMRSLGFVDAGVDTANTRHWSLSREDWVAPSSCIGDLS